MTQIKHTRPYAYSCIYTHTPNSVNASTNHSKSNRIQPSPTMSSSDEEYVDENNPCRPTKRRKLPNSLLHRNTDHTSLTHDEVGLKDHLFFALHRPTHTHNETTDSHINRCDRADTPNEAHRLMIYGDAMKIESVNEVIRRRVEGEETMQTL